MIKKESVDFFSGFKQESSVVYRDGEVSGFKWACADISKQEMQDMLDFLNLVLDKVEVEDFNFDGMGFNVSSVEDTVKVVKRVENTSIQKIRVIYYKKTKKVIFPRLQFEGSIPEFRDILNNIKKYI